MILDVSAGEALVVALVALGVVGPRRIAAVVRRVRGHVRTLRSTVAGTSRSVSEAWSAHRAEFGLDDLRDLDPRRLVRDALADQPAEIDSEFVPVPPPAAATTADVADSATSSSGVARLAQEQTAPAADPA